MRLSNEQYAQAFDQTGGWGIVRAAVDLVIKSEEGVALVQRDIEPELHTWHMPGGKINGGESFQDFANRTAKRDLGIEVEVIDVIGGMNFPAEKSTMEVEGAERELTVHTISIVLLCRAKSTDICGGKEGKNVGWYKTTPPCPHPVHVPWLVKHGFLKEE